MKLVLAAPLYPPEIGGPAMYSKALNKEFARRGIKVDIIDFSHTNTRLPKGLRHLAYFIRLIPKIARADAVITFDTWSAGIPTLFAAKLCGKRLIVRIGGDFLWEEYLNRTRELIKLSVFYDKPHPFTRREWLYRRAGALMLKYADIIFFNTTWQLRIWQKAYGFPEGKARHLENFFPAKREPSLAKDHSFIAAFRPQAFKNLPLLKRIFARVQADYPGITLDTRVLPPAEHLARIRDAYAAIIPSVSEVNANTAVDAILFGKPFIAPLDSGMNDALRTAGIFVDTSDEIALEQAIRKLLDPVAYQEICRRVRSCTFSHSWKAIGDEVLSAL